MARSSPIPVPASYHHEAQRLITKHDAALRSAVYPSLPAFESHHSPAKSLQIGEAGPILPNFSSNLGRSPAYKTRGMVLVGRLVLDPFLQIGYGAFAMTIFSSQRDLLRPRRQFHARVQAWAFAILGTLLIAVPVVRTNELNEVGSAKERVEDVSLVTSSVSLKRTSNHGRREAIVFTSSIQARLGRDQHSQPVPAPGHRLPNGLMAPMTC